jgi:hypothetical protein
MIAYVALVLVVMAENTIGSRPQKKKRRKKKRKKKDSNSVVYRMYDFSWWTEEFVCVDVAHSRSIVQMQSF